MRPTLYDLLPRAGEIPTNDFLLGRFLEYVTSANLELYPAQEAAILELFEEHNVILNTPTGSGKSLVALALQYKALAQGRRSVYTCPIKALVNEKWLALCREFGPDNVGLSTGDGTVNHDAPILCCTAEILANMALSEGSHARAQDVILDEFHYYADRERGGAWQVPLLTLPQARFLLMSATLGDTAFFEQELTTLNGQPTVTIRSTLRPCRWIFSIAKPRWRRRWKTSSPPEKAPCTWCISPRQPPPKARRFYEPAGFQPRGEDRHRPATGGHAFQQSLRFRNQALAAAWHRLAPCRIVAEIPRAR